VGCVPLEGGACLGDGGTEVREGEGEVDPLLGGHNPPDAAAAGPRTVHCGDEGGRRNGTKGGAKGRTGVREKIQRGLAETLNRRGQLGNGR